MILFMDGWVGWLRYWKLNIDVCFVIRYGWVFLLSLSCNNVRYLNAYSIHSVHPSIAFSFSKPPLPPLFISHFPSPISLSFFLSPFLSFFPSFFPQQIPKFPLPSSSHSHKPILRTPHPIIPSSHHPIIPKTPPTPKTLINTGTSRAQEFIENTGPSQPNPMQPRRIHRKQFKPQNRMRHTGLCTPCRSAVTVAPARRLPKPLLQKRGMDFSLSFS